MRSKVYYAIKNNRFIEPILYDKKHEAWLNQYESRGDKIVKVRIVEEPSHE
jgi:hypothetical protein